MSASDSWKLLVFRDGKALRDARELLLELRRALQRVLALSDFTSRSAREALLEALLRSGELECGVIDAASTLAQIDTIAAITDRLAMALLSGRAPELRPISLDKLDGTGWPKLVRVSPAEGFCYYALHPLDYADLLSDVQIRPSTVAVIGIRSIGTTLSAVVRGWFALHGIPAERICVRPNGHPFDRRLTFSFEERNWVASQRLKNALFLVVDEGPGLSGSSFLAVGEALVENGVPREQIVFLPSSAPDLNSLLAPDAAARWSRFRTIALKPTRYLPQEAREDIGAGCWRNMVFALENDWPAVWPWTERKKYLSMERDRFFRFDGLGHYGNVVRGRSQLLAEQGWGPAAEPAGNGFTAFPFLNRRTGGSPLLQGEAGLRSSGESDESEKWVSAPDLAVPTTIRQAAQYCAFRAQHFQSEAPEQTALEHMARINLERAMDIDLPQEFQLPLERPVIADARMMPHEWIVGANGRLLKCDASSHGDDHFFPGPTDIAWDLAGVIVEWNLDQNQAGIFLDEYQRVARDQAQPRLRHYLIAYCAFRFGFTLSAAQSVGGGAEKPRFEREAEQYREKLNQLVGLSTAA